MCDRFEKMNAYAPQGRYDQKGTNRGMKDYELTILIHPDLEKNPEELVDKIKKLVADSDGEVKKEDNEGKRKLAYRLKGQEYALYYFFELGLPAEAPLKVSNVLNITNGVMRYLLVKKDEKLAAKAEKAAEAVNEGEDVAKKKTK